MIYFATMRLYQRMSRAGRTDAIKMRVFVLFYAGTIGADNNITDELIQLTGTPRC